MLSKAGGMIRANLQVLIFNSWSIEEILDVIMTIDAGLTTRRGLILEIVERTRLDRLWTGTAPARRRHAPWGNSLPDDHETTSRARDEPTFSATPIPTDSPIPIMEIHGLEDQIILYSNDAKPSQHGCAEARCDSGDSQWGNMNVAGTRPRDSNGIHVLLRPDVHGSR